MSEKREQSHSKSAERVRALCDDFGITQQQLAEKAGIHKNTISKIVRGHIPMTDYVAESIERAFPSFSKEYLKGEVDYRTEQEQFDTLVQKHRDLHHKKIYILQSIASLRDLEIIPYSIGTNMGEVMEDHFILRQGNKQIYVSSPVLIDRLEEICDFTELRLSRMIRKGESGNG